MDERKERRERRERRSEEKKVVLAGLPN